MAEFFPGVEAGTGQGSTTTTATSSLTTTAAGDGTSSATSTAAVASTTTVVVLGASWAVPIKLAVGGMLVAWAGF